MRALPNELAVKVMFKKVCERYRELTAKGKAYVPMTDKEIEKMMAEVLGAKK